MELKTNSCKKEVIPVGPIGSEAFCDERWDEKGRNMISDIYITHDDTDIKSIKFIYFHDEAPPVSAKHGDLRLSWGGWRLHEMQNTRIRLDHDEYVTGLSGIDWESGITSLTFYTNKRKHGPICKRFDHLKKYYKREINVGIRDRREFGGFFGSFCDIRGCLSSIGIYFCPVTSINGAVLTTEHKLTEVPYANLFLFGLKFSDYVDTSNYNLSLEYQSLLDGSHVKPKLKDRIFSKLGRLFRNLLKLD